MGCVNLGKSFNLFVPLCTSKARIITLVLLIDLTVVGSLKMNYVMVL